MSETIKLRVPSKPAVEYVSQGNHSATLTPSGVITVDNRSFADWLVNEYALAEVDTDSNQQSPVGSAEPENPQSKIENPKSEDVGGNK